MVDHDDYFIGDPNSNDNFNDDRPDWLEEEDYDAEDLDDDYGHNDHDYDS